MDIDSYLIPFASLSSEEFELYMDPKNLPREFGSQHAKRNARDVVLYTVQIEELGSGVFVHSHHIWSTDGIE